MAGTALSALPPGIAEQVHEIRLRVGCGVQLTIGGKPCRLAELPALQKPRLTPLQMEEIFPSPCGGSVQQPRDRNCGGLCHAQLWVPRRLAGQFYCAHRGRASVLQELRSVNIRVARTGNFLCRKNSGIFCSSDLSMLLMGEPDSGKTTLLRGVARELAKCAAVLSRRQAEGYSPREALARHLNQSEDRRANGSAYPLAADLWTAESGWTSFTPLEGLFQRDAPPHHAAS